MLLAGTSAVLACIFFGHRLLIVHEFLQRVRKEDKRLESALNFLGAVSRSATHLMEKELAALSARLTDQTSAHAYFFGILSATREVLEAIRARRLQHGSVRTNAGIVVPTEHGITSRIETFTAFEVVLSQLARAYEQQSNSCGRRIAAVVETLKFGLQMHAVSYRKISLNKI